MSQTIDLLKNSSFEDGMDLLETAIDGVASAISELSVNKSLNDLTNVNITNPQNEQVLSYNNGVWVNAEGGGGGNANIWVGHQSDYNPDDPTIPLNALVCFDDDSEEITYAEGVAF